MEAINRTIAEMSNLFGERMSAFEKELQKTPCSSAVTTATLTAEFASFRAFVVQALGTLQQQVAMLAQNQDNMEMRGRRKILLLHGVSEEQDEVTAQVVAQILKQRLDVDLDSSGIRRCHRMGRSISHKPRPILFKLCDMALRDKIWFSKTKLKGSGVTVSEFLTKTRHNVFMAARDRFGVSQCWTSEGTVFVLDSKGRRHRVTSSTELNRIGQQSELTATQPEQVSGQPEPGDAQPVAVEKVAAVKSRRIVARK